jgi:hypothetical protein
MKMTIKSEYLSERQFINVCKKYSLIKKFCAETGLQITPSLVRKNIVPAKGKQYLESQKTELYKKISNDGDFFHSISAKKNEARIERKKAAKYVQEFVNLLRQNPLQYPLFDDPAVRSFLMAILSDHFNERIQGARKEIGIPVYGFASEEELQKWALQRNLPAQNSAEIEFDFESTIKAHREAQLLADLILTLQTKYKIFDHQVFYAYIFYDFNRLSDLVVRLAIMPTFKPTATITTRGQHYKLINGNWLDSPEAAAKKKIAIWEFPNENVDGWIGANITPDSFYVHIALPRRGFQKTDFDKFFRKYGAKIHKEYREFYKELKIHSPLNFGDRWLIYFLNEKLKMPLAEINSVISVSKDNLKKIHQDFQGQLAALERDD